MKYVFILGNNPELSIAEIKAVYPKINILEKTNIYLIGEIADDFDCHQAINILGGTIKIGQVISQKINTSIIKKEIIKGQRVHPIGYYELNDTDQPSKVNFGFSFYNTKPNKIGMEIKRDLKQEKISSRLVVSREKILSSVIVKKNKVIDFLVLPNCLGVTCAVQEFEAYGHRDFGRPKSDSLSGMLPPKLARMMINLSGAKTNQTILDPFCGSGTVLAEAMALGFTNLIGSDLSEKAVSDTIANLDWLKKELEIRNWKLEIINCDATKLSQKIKSSSVDAIVTEPFLGPPIRGGETENTIIKIINDLRILYLNSFKEFAKVLKPNGRVVIIIPSWHLPQTFNLPIAKEIAKLGFNRLDVGDLVYKREGQKVWRQIQVWSKI